MDTSDIEGISYQERRWAASYLRECATRERDRASRARRGAPRSEPTPATSADGHDHAALCLEVAADHILGSVRESAPELPALTSCARLRREHADDGKWVYRWDAHRVSRPAGLLTTDPCCGVVLVDVGHVRVFDGAPVASVDVANLALRRVNVATAFPGVSISVVFDRDPGADAFLLLEHPAERFPSKHYPGRR